LLITSTAEEQEVKRNVENIMSEWKIRAVMLGFDIILSIFFMKVRPLQRNESLKKMEQLINNFFYLRSKY